MNWRCTTNCSKSSFSKRLCRLSFYPNGCARHKRRQGPTLARKYDKYDDVGQDIVPNFQTTKTEHLPQARSTILQRRRNLPRFVLQPRRGAKGVPHMNQVASNVHSLLSRSSTTQPQNGGDDEENASYNSAAQPENHAIDTQDDTEDMPCVTIPLTKAEAMTGLKSLSSIPSSPISNPATAALTALAVIAADAAEPVQYRFCNNFTFQPPYGPCPFMTCRLRLPTHHPLVLVWIRLPLPHVLEPPHQTTTTTTKFLLKPCQRKELVEVTDIFLLDRGRRWLTGGVYLRPFVLQTPLARRRRALLRLSI